jgi:hypothetical protein
VNISAFDLLIRLATQPHQDQVNSNRRLHRNFDWLRPDEVEPEAFRRSELQEKVIQRVARAVHFASASGSPDWDKLDSVQRAERTAQAKAAIFALRAPSDAMLLAAIRLDPTCTVEQLWPAMIDSALME